MIDEHEIKTRDFSCVLPIIINKLMFIGFSLTGNDVSTLSTPSLRGAGDIIVDVAQDLREINNALYWDEKEAPGTETLSGEDG